MIKRLGVLVPLLAILSSKISHGQGFLPPQSSSSTATVEHTGPLLIGEKVPETLTVIDENGKLRTLLSYKSPLEILVVVFFSFPCEPGEAQWSTFRRLHERYKDWRVAFLAMTSTGEVLKKQKLFWPRVSDDQGKALNLFKITATPEVVIIDEYGNLKYRGPVAEVATALDAIIGHSDAVPSPEPPLTGGCSL